MNNAEHRKILKQWFLDYGVQDKEEARNRSEFNFDEALLAALPDESQAKEELCEDEGCPQSHVEHIGIDTGPIDEELIRKGFESRYKGVFSDSDSDFFERGPSNKYTSGMIQWAWAGYLSRAREEAARRVRDKCKPNMPRTTETDETDIPDVVLRQCSRKFVEDAFGKERAAKVFDAPDNITVTYETSPAFPSKELEKKWLSLGKKRSD